MMEKLLLFHLYIELQYWHLTAKKMSREKYWRAPWFDVCTFDLARVMKFSNRTLAKTMLPLSVCVRCTVRLSSNFENRRVQWTSPSQCCHLLLHRQEWEEMQPTCLGYVRICPYIMLYVYMIDERDSSLFHKSSCFYGSVYCIFILNNSVHDSINNWSCGPKRKKTSKWKMTTSISVSWMMESYLEVGIPFLRRKSKVSLTNI